MADAWQSLLPIVLASMLSPIQLAITIILLRSSVAAAGGWVAGLTVARAVEGVLLAAALAFGATGALLDDGPSQLIGWLVLALGLLFYAAAVQQWIRPSAFDTAMDAAIRRFESASPGLAFGSGLLYLVLSVKSTLLNLLGIGTIIGAVPPGAARILSVGGFIVIVMAGHIAILLMAASSPERAKARLERLDGWLRRHSRAVIITLGLVFGTVFVASAIQALQG